MVATPLALVVGETEPHGPGEHDTVQITPIFVGSLLTVAVICDVVLIGTVVGFAVTVTAVPRTVTVAKFDTEALAREVAVMVTAKSLAGGVVGAVKVVAIPLAVVVGEAEPHGAGEHDTVQVTPLFVGSLATVAVMCAVPRA